MMFQLCLLYIHVKFVTIIDHYHFRLARGTFLVVLILFCNSCVSCTFSGVKQGLLNCEWQHQMELYKKILG